MSSPKQTAKGSAAVDLGRVHPAALLLPPMSQDDFDLLVADLKANGLREPVVLDKERQILDGRNRAKTCIELGIALSTTVFGGEDPVAFVVSRNIARRMLTRSQLGCVGLLVLDAMNARGPNGPRRNGRAREEAAQLIGGKARTIERAKFVRDRDPRLFDQVFLGVTTLGAAEKVIQRRDATMVDALNSAAAKKSVSTTAPKASNTPKATPATERAFSSPPPKAQPHKTTAERAPSTDDNTIDETAALIVRITDAVVKRFRLNKRAAEVREVVLDAVYSAADVK